MGDTGPAMNAFFLSQDQQGQKERLADKKNAAGSVTGQPTGAGTANASIFNPITGTAQSKQPPGNNLASSVAGMFGGVQQPRTQNQGVAIQSKIQSQRQRALNGASVGGAPPAGATGKTALGS